MKYFFIYIFIIVLSQNIFINFSLIFFSSFMSISLVYSKYAELTKYYKIKFISKKDKVKRLVTIHLPFTKTSTIMYWIFDLLLRTYMSLIVQIRFYFYLHALTNNETGGDIDFLNSCAQWNNDKALQ